MYDGFWGYRDRFKNARQLAKGLKSELIESQRTVVKLQRGWLEIQSNHLKSMPTVVDKVIKKGMTTQCLAVAESLKLQLNSGPIPSAEKLKEAVSERKPRIDADASCYHS
jgi:hypothetical protein